MSLPEQSIRDLIQNAGLLVPWTSYDASTQPAPKVQLFELDEPGASDNERILLIRQLGRGNSDTRYVASQPFVIAMMSIAQNGDEGHARSYMEQVKDAVNAFPGSVNCLIGFDLLGQVGGPYAMESGRRAYDLELVVKIDQGIDTA